MPRKVNMHRFNGFGLGVYGGRTLENGDVEMAHGQIYSIKMENNRDTVAEGILKVEGKVIGSFLLYPHHKIEIEIEKLTSLINSAKAQGAANIEEKAQQLLDTVKWEQKKLNAGRRFFYHRLKALDLIEE